MSRRLPSTSSHRHTASTSDNTHHPYQTSAHNLPPNGYHYQKSHHKYKEYHHSRCQNPCRNGCPKQNTTTIDIGLSDETFTDSQTYYDYYQDDGFPHSPLKESRNTVCTFSDDSGSTRLPYYEIDAESNKRYSRGDFSDRSLRNNHKGKANNANVHGKDLRKVYPNQDVGWDRLYHEIATPCDNAPVSSSNSRRQPTSRNSDRPQSSLSSGVSNAIIYGCGGKCQTFENVCYFFLQLVFTMGILIGVSLCIAGLVLRKSAARNLQVLVYIGVLLAMVSGLLLSIQCNARITARKRKKAIQNAKRAPIQLDTLHVRNNPLQQQQLLILKDGQQRVVVPMPQVHGSAPHPHQHMPGRSISPALTDEQGIPWWRRKDLNAR